MVTNTTAMRRLEIANTKNRSDRGVVFVQTTVVLIGIIMIIVALAADRLVPNGYPGFGPSQIILVTAGGGVLLAGLILRVRVVRQSVQRFMRSRVVLVLGGVLAGLLLLESGLRLVELFGRRQPNQVVNEMRGLFSQAIPDSKLGLRLAPYAGGHDAKGFRNNIVPDQVDVVAIGDSQTWGINASRPEAWPQTLAKLSNRGVYNMGLGYYGPVHYWILVEEALELSPQVIVIGLYFGNDLYDAYRMVYSSETYARFRHPERSDDLLSDTITPRVQALSNEVAKFQKEFPDIRFPLSGGVWLTEHSAIGRLLCKRGVCPRTMTRDQYEAARAWAQAFPEHGTLYEHGDVRTVLTTAYRVLALDLDDPRIAEGLRITREMLLNIQDRTDATDTKLLVLLIPTKEMVYADAVKGNQGYLEETYARLAQMETRARNEIITLCNDNNIECVDALPVLVAAIQRHEQIYPPSIDGHPTPQGYFLLASTVAKALVRLGWE